MKLPPQRASENVGGNVRVTVVNDSRDPFALQGPGQRFVETEHRLLARVLNWLSIATGYLGRRSVA